MEKTHTVYDWSGSEEALFVLSTVFKHVKHNLTFFGIQDNVIFVDLSNDCWRYINKIGDAYIPLSFLHVKCYKCNFKHLKENIPF